MNQPAFALRFRLRVERYAGQVAPSEDWWALQDLKSRADPRVCRSQQGRARKEAHNGKTHPQASKIFLMLENGFLTEPAKP